MTYRVSYLRAGSLFDWSEIYIKRLKATEAFRARGAFVISCQGDITQLYWRHTSEPHLICDVMLIRSSSRDDLEK